MTKKWIGINLLLLVLVAIAGRQLYVSVQQFKAENDLSKIQPDRTLSQKIAQETILPTPPVDIRYDASDFAVIPEKNIFLESRRREGSSDTPVPTGTMPASQKPTLVGVILTETQKIASILEPRSRGLNAGVQFKRIGDEYAGYTITDIASDHIVLDNGRQKEIITLDESSQSARRGRTNYVPTRVVSIGGGATTGNIPVSIVARGTGTPSSTPVSSVRTVDPRTTSSVRDNVVPVAGILPGGSQQAVLDSQENEQQQEEIQRPKSQPPVSTPGRAQRDPRVIRTPFGDILRPDP